MILKYLLFFFIFIYPSFSGRSQSPCATTQFAKIYRFNGFLSSGSFDTTNGGGMVWGFVKNYKQVLFKGDSDGNLLWSKQYDTPDLNYYTDISSISPDMNGNMVFINNSDCISLADGFGNLLASKKLVLTSFMPTIVQVGVLPNNNKIILLNENLYGSSVGYRLICLSPDISSVIWARRISGYSYYTSGFKISGLDIYLNGSHNNQGIITKYNSSGLLQYCTQYFTDNKQTTISEINPYNGGCVVTARYFGGEINNHIILRINDNGGIIKSYRLQNLFDNAQLKATTTVDGDFYGLWSTAGGFSKSCFFVTKNDSILWCRQSLGSGLGLPINIIKSPLGIITCSAGNYNNVGSGAAADFSIARLDANGIFKNCSYFNFNFNKVPIPTVVSNSTLLCEVFNSLVLQPINVSTIINPGALLVNCHSTSLCNNLEIGGSTTLCSSSTSTYFAQRNLGCNTPVDWTISGGSYSKQLLSDSSIFIDFLQSGNYVLIGRLAGNCSSIADTINISVTLVSSQNILNIGPADTSLCLNNNIILNAHRGFASYLWQDNSTDSTFTVTQPGIYFVKTTNACGLAFYDTIQVNAYPLINFNLGNDRNKCNEDTIQLNATSGFYNYKWSPNYFISSLNTSNVIVSPLIDTIYYLQAEKFPGCIVFDTIKINVKSAPLINLGSDKYVCEDSIITLTGGSGYNFYTWNTGEHTMSINTSDTGTFSVYAVYPNGCIVRDTIKINSLPKPYLQLNYPSVFCINNAGLSPGTFNSYLWHDGSTASTHPVSSIGEYSVTVSNLQGCKASDTAHILALLPNPKNFLPGDTTLCSYELLTLKTKTPYFNYLWNAGSTNSTIVISNPGIYSLKITDQNGCEGKDSIEVVSKDCLKGIFFPSAFTPNNDNKNEFFKPNIFGKIDEYQFVIYNRYTEIIFKTTQIGLGWDGKYKGIFQNSGGYVYVCNYRFTGEKSIIKKGTFLLLK